MESLTPMSALTALVWAGIAIAALSLYQHRQIPAWTERAITPALGWAAIVPLQLAAAAIAAVGLAPTWGVPAAVAGAMFAWLSVLAVATDIATRKVPWDISYPPAAIGVVAFALAYNIEGALSLAAALLGVVGIPMLARTLTRKGLGMSDVRLLIAATAATSWWIGQNWLLYALIAASLLQLLIRLLAPTLGWGMQVPVPNRNPEPTEPTDTRGDHSGQDEEAKRAAYAGETEDGESASRGEVRTRLELPFAPALLTSVWAFIAYATITGYGACQMWNPFGCS